MKARRVLFLAIALSLLLHLIVAVVLHPLSHGRSEQPETVSIERRPTSIAMTRMPTPPPSTPRPRPTASPRASASARPSTRTSRKLGTRARLGHARTVATPPPTAPPAATAPPSAAPCAHADAGATVTATPAPPDIAPGVRAAGASGVAQIAVRLDAQGDVTGTTVTQTTGNASLDLVAVAMARSAQYAPALHECKPVASIYTYSVNFVAW